MLSLLRQRNYALLWSGGLISGTGTAMLVAALPYYVYATSHSVTASGTALFSEILPGVLFNTVGGVFADRLPRKMAMAAGNGGRGVLILPLFAVHGPSTLWIVYVVGLLNGTLAALAGPFGNAALPHFVRTEDLPAANAGFSAASSTAVLIGSPLGGALLQQVGLSAVVLIDAISFAVPTIAILMIDVPLEDRRREAPQGMTRPHPVGDLLRGWRYVSRTPAVAGVFLVTIVNYLGAAVFFVAFAPFVRHILAGSAEYYSCAVTLTGVSGMAGALVMGAAGRRAGPRALAAGGLIFLGVIALVEVLAANRVLTLVISLLVGVPSEFVGASLNSLIQAGAEDAYRGRVYGTYATTTSLTLLLGTVFATLVADRLGIRAALIGGSLVLLLAGSIAMTVLPRKLST